jgi:type III secretion protein Q
MFNPIKLTQADANAGDAASRLVALAAREFGLALACGGGGDTAVDSVQLTLSVNDAPCDIVVPKSALNTLARSFFELNDDHVLPQELVASSLEAALEPWLARLEQVSGARITMQHVASAAPDRPAASRLAFRLSGSGIDTLLTVEPGKGLSIASPPRVAWTEGDELGARLPIIIAEVSIRLRDLTGLETGDVVLLEGVAPPAVSQVYLPISPSLSIVAALEGQTIIVDRLGKTMSMTETSNEETPGDPPAALLPPDTIEDLSLKVVFDLGEIELTLAELRRLVPGQTMDLARPPGHTVRMSVNGRRIGAGEIVEIEGRLGVRISELAGGHERPAS